MTMKFKRQYHSKSVNPASQSNCFEQTYADCGKMKMRNPVVSSFCYGKEQNHEGSQAIRFPGNFPAAQSN
jgi:hypothetical protein